MGGVCMQPKKLQIVESSYGKKEEINCINASFMYTDGDPHVMNRNRVLAKEDQEWTSHINGHQEVMNGKNVPIQGNQKLVNGDNAPKKEDQPLMNGKPSSVKGDRKFMKGEHAPKKGQTLMNGNHESNKGNLKLMNGGKCVPDKIDLKLRNENDELMYNNNQYNKNSYDSKTIYGNDKKYESNRQSNISRNSKDFLKSDKNEFEADIADINVSLEISGKDCKPCSIKEVSDETKSASQVKSIETTRARSKVNYRQEALKFTNSVIELINKETLLLGPQHDTKVVEFHHPSELQKLLRLEISNEGDSNSELISLCEDVIKYSVRTGSTGFYNQLYHGGDPYGITAALLTEALNTSEYTFEVAPVFVIVADYIVSRITRLAGYPDGDGVFVPGGSIGNIMSLSMARYRYNEDIKLNGMFNIARLVVLTSEDSHYSLRKGAALLGFGMNSVIGVKTDERGCMCIDDLKKQIENEKDKGNTPIAVVATAGTTVLGAYDDLEAVADVCETHQMWMHVDSCWGGGVLFSPKHRSLMKGIERSDSFCISLHKMMGAPLQCVPLLTKQKGILQQTFAFGATCLFQQDKFYDISYDIGDKTIQCGRKGDALKFWLMWKARGDDGMARHVDDAFEMASLFKKKILLSEGFRLVIPEFQCLNVGFWYIPPSMRGKEENDKWWDQLSKVAPQIKEKMVLKGTLLMGFMPLASKGFVNFFRIIIESPRLTETNLEFVIEEITRLGCDL